ncbi:disulfide oxidoreductase [Jeotgalibacillus sp. R-1-5s-1]|uniref:disulfide oxidoreductase n=1 Tax=Jeotgalibacillus sp. R-1-5s-1 TaxID=2555897 RepID=UPI00106C3868|nr:disulfide oxidoreductase [Jeotgalibacillus sp. R-1-5s-1]TFD91895.1 disulfide bond formation protein B [Jeotgalibacillus sp. R-1-5s-1]
MTKKIENLLFLAWAASFTATVGSLYFSEIRDFVPCDMCWYQRIFMYPIVIVLGAAIIKKDAKAALYSALLSGIGGSISLYHYGIQKLDFLSESAPACGVVSCTGQYINWLGFITIPFLALTAFIIIFISSIVILKQSKGAPSK